MNEKSIKTCQIHNENYNSIIQWGFRHPAARYLDASVYEIFYFETYFFYTLYCLIYSELFCVPDPDGTRMFYQCLIITLYLFNRTVKFNSKITAIGFSLFFDH